MIPTSVFVVLSELDSTLLIKFLQLCKGLKQHLEYEIQQRFKAVFDGVKTKYAEFFELDKAFLWVQPITFAKKSALRVD